MENHPTHQQLAKIPKLHKNDHIQMKDKIIHLHFTFPRCDWYIAEFDGKDTFFGFVILNNDLLFAEWGYISFEFLKIVDIAGKQIELDLDWKPQKASDVQRICQAQRWDV
ncbi:MAG: DUF2958 domain-containing protein [Desulfobacterales bacterium]|nr:DUF2958 domain-containing protein [Desulfobacterales bacterium]